MKRALITGITGQDGSYMADFLLGKGYEVHGLVRRVAFQDPEQRFQRIRHILDRVTLHSGAVESFPNVFSIMNALKPDECYHYAGQSYVAYSFEDEYSTMLVNTTGTHHILAAIRECAPHCRLYFPATGEMFGNPESSAQNESTPCFPCSSYGVSKLAACHLVRMYREVHGVFASVGISMNHESPRRGFDFISRKVSRAVARIKLGLETELRVGNIEARRDWGFAGDYVRAMWMMLQQDRPDDYVIATGEQHSVRELIETAFAHVGLDWERYTVFDPSCLRLRDVNALRGDNRKIREKLGWEPKVNFEQLIRMMVDADLADLGAARELGLPEGDMFPFGELAEERDAEALAV